MNQMLPTMLCIGTGAAMVFLNAPFFGFLAMCLGVLMFLASFPAISGVPA